MRTSARITLLAAEESSLTFLEEVLPELSDFSSGENSGRQVLALAIKRILRAVY